MNQERIATINLLKNSTYQQIIEMIIESKTGDPDKWKQVDQHNINEVIDNLDWVVSLALNEEIQPDL